MIEDPAIRLGKLAADRLVAAAAAQLPEPSAAPEAIGVFHGTLDQARALAVLAGLPEPSSVVVQGRAGYATGGRLMVEFAGGVLVGPSALVAEALGKLDEEQCAAMVAKNREKTDGSQGPAAGAEPPA